MQHLGDITKLDGANVPPVDVIIGGSPCQGLSVAGKQKGLQDDRSCLFLEQIRIVKEMRNATKRTDGIERPRYLVWENVPGAFSSNKGEDFRRVLEEICKVKDERASVPRPTGGVNGEIAVASWETGIQSLGEFSMQSFGERPNAAAVSRLSQILEVSPHPKYYLSETACMGILRRAAKRGVEIKPILKAVLMKQSGLTVTTKPTQET